MLGCSNLSDHEEQNESGSDLEIKRIKWIKNKRPYEVVSGGGGKSLNAAESYK